MVVFEVSTGQENGSLKRNPKLLQEEGSHHRPWCLRCIWICAKDGSL